MTEAPRAAAGAGKLEGYRRSAYAVWEITLKCNLACKHCGSRAGEAREQELDTAEALDLIRQMAEVGITEVTLIGGEAYLRPDWLTLAKAIDDAGMICTVVTGGLGVSRFTAKKMKEAGVAQASVSIDGLKDTHNHLRGKPNSFQQCFETMKHFRDVGLQFSVNTQVNRLSAPDFPSLYELAKDAGMSAWQFSLTVPMGNAADRPELLLQPAELVDLYPMLARVAWRAHQEGVMVLPGNDIGFFGPFENVLRVDQHALDMYWQGCQAGNGALGIEADGTIKGCPSLPTDDYAGGNIRKRALKQILRTRPLTFNSHGGTARGVEHLWGHCRTCEFAELCRGGCTWTAHVFFDRPGNNVHCHSRALRLKAQGLRERVVQVEKPPGLPFDNGRFEILEEPFDAPWPKDDALHFTADRVRWGPSWKRWPFPPGEGATAP